MSRDEIMALDGRALDVEIAKLMGTRITYSACAESLEPNGDGTRLKASIGDTTSLEECLNLCERLNKNPRWSRMGPFKPRPWSSKSYSSDIAAAWEVVERMREQGWSVNIHRISADEWTCAFGVDQHFWFWHVHESLPRAACVAALLAVEGDA